jgi:vacuolar protein sorting-associated protein VTA1
VLKGGRQTADTFQAAATFLELVNIWGPPDGETQAKIKYAKWNAIRIVKALKEGKDPNESNPKPQQQEETSPASDPNDIDALQVGESDKYRKPSVQEVSDEPDQVDRKTTRQSSIDQSLNPSTQVSAHGSPSTKYEPYPRDGFPYTAVHDDNVSPLEPSNPNGRDGSIGGGYFPQVPTFTSEVRDSALPTAPPDDAVDLGLPDHPSTSQAFGTGANFESFPPPALDDGLPSAPAPEPQDYYRAPPQVQAPHPSPPHAPNPPSVPQPSRDLQMQTPHPAPAHPPPMQSRVTGKEQLNTDDAAIAKAQKHARWAISALNFEDAETAVRELRNALKTLGAEA